MNFDELTSRQKDQLRLVDQGKQSPTQTSYDPYDPETVAAELDDLEVRGIKPGVVLLNYWGDVGRVVKVGKGRKPRDRADRTYVSVKRISKSSGRRSVQRANYRTAIQHTIVEGA